MEQIERSARLLLQTSAGEVLRTYPLSATETTIGRASTRAISIPTDKLISRRHAIVCYENGNYVLRDDGSVNGTFVNDRTLQPGQSYILQHGDRIRLGRHYLIFQMAAMSAAVNTADLVGPPASAPAAGSFTDGEVQEPISGPLSSETMKSQAIYSAATSSDLLRFSAFYPPEVAVGTWHSLLVYAHLAHVMEAVYQDAASFRSETAVQAQKISEQARPFSLQGSSITVVPECKGVSFNPRRFTFQWQEDWHRVEFRFSAKKEYIGLNAYGRISIFAGPLLVGTLRLALLLDEPHIILQEEQADVTVNLCNAVYASYSPQDALIGQQCRAVYKALGAQAAIIDDALRSDQHFSNEQKRMIEASEVLQVFWSSHAAHSALVAREVEYARQLNRGEGFIRPVYWEVPRVPPSEELSSLPFTYLPLYTLK